MRLVQLANKRKMADVSPVEVSPKHEVVNDGDSPPTSSPPPETAIEEFPPKVKEEVEDPAPKVVRSVSEMCTGSGHGS